ncbi:hypothetical protein ACFQ0B_28675 [Nonomuraea thailandensis]
MPAPTPAISVSTPARRWNQVCRSRHPTTARRSTTACARRSDPDRTARRPPS